MAIADGSTRKMLDAFTLPDVPAAEAQLETLAAIATLRGIEPADIRHARVLEIGCGDGASLLSMADCFGQSTFVGVDTSERSIASARQATAMLKLPNIEFQHVESLANLRVSEPLDYIIARRIYSRVEHPQRDQLLAICQRHLAPRGVALIGYETRPGSEVRSALGHVLRYDTRNTGSPPQAAFRVRSLLGFLETSMAKEQAPICQFVLDQIRSMKNWNDTELGAEALVRPSDPVYLREFLTHVRQHGLQYLGDATVGIAFVDTMAPEIEKVIQSLSADLLEQEAVRDILQFRQMRATLLCHANVGIDPKLSAERLGPLHLEAQLRPEEISPMITSTDSAGFALPNGSRVSTSIPLIKAAFLELGKAFPRSMQFDELVLASCARLESQTPAAEPTPEQEVARLRASLVECCASRLIDVLAQPFGFVRSASAQPHATAWTRLQAARGAIIISRKHRAMRMQGLDHRALQLCDGSTTRAQMIDLLVRDFEARKLVIEEEGVPIQNAARAREVLPGLLEECLIRLAFNAYFVD